LDLDLIFKIAGVGMIVAVLNMILKKAGKEEYELLITIAGLIIVLMVMIDEIKRLFDTVRSVFGF
jgi:stage III sporulation protein AC